MSDYILRASAANGQARAFFATTRDTVGEAARIHKTSPVMSAALGRLLTAGAIMGRQLKNDGDLVTLHIKGDGPGGSVLVTAGPSGDVKGYPGEPDVDLPLNKIGKLDVSGAIGSGTLTVIKDTGEKEPYNGMVELQTGEIAEDVAYYFAQSEQTPSAVALGVLVNKDLTIRQAGGFMIQLTPGASFDIIEYLEKKTAGIKSLTSLYEEGHTPESVAELLLGDIGYEITEKTPVRYFCGCDRARVEKALRALGPEEISRIAREDKEADVNCHFCNKTYYFSQKELLEL